MRLQFHGRGLMVERAADYLFQLFSKRALYFVFDDVKLCVKLLFPSVRMELFFFYSGQRSK